VDKRLSRIAWIGLLLATATTAWSADVTTSITNVGNESRDQVLGSFTLSFDEDAFPNASPANPAYIRFRLNQANGWSKTLVDLRPGAPDYLRRPLNIALYPASGGSLNPGLPPSAVQLVRLIEGEQAGWLKVTASSSQWVSDNGTFVPPSQGSRVSLTVGLRGQNSVRPAANTPTGGNETPNGILASTLLRADYQNTPWFGVGDLETLDFIAFDSTTAGVEQGDSPQPGLNIGLGFSNDPAIARGDANIPCFEYHFAPADFDSAPPKLGVNRLHQITRDRYCVNSPPVYLTNSSDFEWKPGSRFYLVLYGHDPDYLVHGGLPYCDPNPRRIELLETDITVTPSDDTAWQVEKIYCQDGFVGWELTQLEGDFDIFSQLEIRGLKACFGEKFEGDRLLLSARAYFFHPVFSDGELELIGEIPRETLILESAPDDLERRILPFTGHDRPDWDVRLNVVNLSDAPAEFAAFLYQRQGILTRVFSQYRLPPRGSVSLDLFELYEPAIASTITWAELLSTGPVGAAAVVESGDRRTLDIVPAVKEARQRLYGSHVPIDDVFWETSAYVVSSANEVDSDYDLKLPGQAPADIRALRAPRYSTVLLDGDFYNDFQERSPWFLINATAPTANGVLFFGRKDNGSQLASISLDETPQTTWRFDHLGAAANGWWNGLILLNPSAEAATITLTGYADDGSPLGSRDLALQPETKLVDFVAALLQLQNEPTPSRLEVASDAPIIASMLFGRQDLEVLTNVPGNLPEQTAATLCCLPQTEDDWSGVALINGRNRTIRTAILPVRSDGTMGEAVELDLGPNEKSLFLLRDLIAEPWTYDHVVIEAGGPIRILGLTGNFERGQMATVPALQ